MFKETENSLLAKLRQWRDRPKQPAELTTNPHHVTEQDVLHIQHLQRQLQQQKEELNDDI